MLLFQQLQQLEGTLGIHTPHRYNSWRALASSEDNIQHQKFSAYSRVKKQYIIIQEDYLHQGFPDD